MPSFILDRCGWACNMSSPLTAPTPSPSQFSRKWGRGGSSREGVAPKAQPAPSELGQRLGPGLGPCAWCTLQPLTL